MIFRRSQLHPAARRAASVVLAVCAMLVPASGLAQKPDLGAKSERASQAMAAAKYEEAIAIYSELARELPNDGGMLMNLGMAQSLAGRQRDAIGTLQRAVKLQPALHAAWLFLGIAHLESGNAASAVAPLLKAVSTDPRSVKARRVLADAYLSLERYDAAGRQLQKVIEADPKDPAAWYALGQTHEARANLAFDRLRQLAPESAYVSLLVADVLLAQEKYDEAVKLYSAALENPRLKGVALEMLVGIHEAAGRAAEAADARRQLAALPAPDCVRAKAGCEFRAGRFAGALAALEGRQDAESHYWRARAHNELAAEAFTKLEELPASAESHQFRALLYRSQGRHLESAGELRQAIALAPDMPRLQEELARSLYLSRDYEAAGQLLEKLVKQAAPSAELRFLYGDTLLQAQKVEQAVPLLEAAVAADGKLLPARASLARAYLQLGRQADAIPHLKAALEIDEDGSLHYQLARAYQATGQAALAKQMLAKYEAMQKEKR